MTKSPASFLNQHVGSFFEGILSIFLFIPYFFSVTTLLRTLFSPWKGLTTQSQSKGFSMKDMTDVFMGNLIASGIGFSIRVSVLAIFFVIQSLYILLIPVLILCFLLLIPVQFLFYLLLPSEDENKDHRRAAFIKNHTLSQQNQVLSGQWFDYLYAEEVKRRQWWKLENLFESVPLGSDWAAGYTYHLDQYSTEISGGNYQSNRKHLVGREEQIDQIEQSLIKTSAANVILVGETGVGKHTVLDAFARRVFHGTTHQLLAYKRILKIDLEKVLSSAKDPKEREVILSSLFKEAEKAKNIIILVDDFDRYVVSGDPNRVDLTEVFETFAASPHVQLIGITTPQAYNTYIFRNDKLKHVFEKIDVPEISKIDAQRILFEQTPLFEKRYHLAIPVETVLAIVEKSDFFITTIPFPEKAIHLLDSVCVYARETLKQKLVSPEMIDPVLSEQTHTPTTLDATMKDKLLHLEENIAKVVVNQDGAVHEVGAAMRRAFLLLGKRRKPLASFLFLGPTGVGKTETAKAITSTFFGNDTFLMRFDMSLYQSKEDIPTLIGTGSEPGALTSAIRQQPYGVLLLDEIEKADIDLLNIFLTILDEGYFTDGFGQKVDCKNLVIIATSNAGADYIYTNLKNGKSLSSNEIIAYLIDQHIYTPEFLNRFDGAVAFQPMNNTSMLPIAKKMLAQIQQNLRDLYQVNLEVSDETLQYVISHNVDPAFGARNLDRVLRDQIEDQVAQLILSGKAQAGSTIKM